jgi:hemerythrin
VKVTELVWQESWSVAEPRLDQEHQGLVALINALRVAQEQQLTELDLDVFVHQVVSELVAYAEDHFRYEESLMAEAGYPDLGHHREGHLHFRRQVADMASRVGDHPQALKDLHTFLGAWLKHHILDQDLRYVPYLQAARG